MHSWIYFVTYCLCYFLTNMCCILQHGPQILYVIWAALWLAYHLIWILIEAYWSLTNTPGKWMLLLTNLSYLALAFLTLIDFVCCLYVCCLRPDIANGKRSLVMLKTAIYIVHVYRCIF